MPYHSYTKPEQNTLNGFFEAHREAFLDAVITNGFDLTAPPLPQLVTFLLQHCPPPPSDPVQLLLQSGMIQHNDNITYFKTWHAILLADLDRVQQDFTKYNANAVKMGKAPIPSLKDFWRAQLAAKAAGPVRLHDGGILADGTLAAITAAQQDLELSPVDAKTAVQPLMSMGAGDLHPRFTPQYPLCHQTIWSATEGTKDKTTGGNKKLTLFYEQVTETVGGHSGHRYYLVAKGVHQKDSYHVTKTIPIPPGVSRGFTASATLSFGGSGAELPPQAPPGGGGGAGAPPPPQPKQKPKPPRKRH